MVVDPTLGVVSFSIPYRILVVYKLGFVEVFVVVVAPLVGFCTWVCSNTHVSHDLCIFSQCCTISRVWVLAGILVVDWHLVVWI